jgi:hypothetical protein
METKGMKQIIQILISCVWISTCCANSEVDGRFTASLSDGTGIELVGLRNFSHNDLKEFKDGNYPWWEPDGTVLSVSPDTWTGRTSSSGSYWFVIRVKGSGDYGFRAVGPLGEDLTVHPVERKGRGFENDDLRHFSLRFAMDSAQADFKLGVACSDWRVVENWPISKHSDPYSHFFCSSEQVVMRCPEQVGSDVVAEVTQITGDNATRLVVFDKDGNEYESLGSKGGESAGLVRYIHRFKDMNRDNIERLEFQTRPYDYWITFENVSLKLGHNTNVKVQISRPGYLLPGESVPGLEGIKIDFNTEQAKDRKMLVCFFDMNQRPSRRSILQIAEQSEKLKQKNIIVIIVQASEVDKNSLDEWLKENDITFATGMIQDKAEQIRFNWGVKSLPWLILTDRNHVVKAEGIDINGIDEKIGELTDVGN